MAEQDVNATNNDTITVHGLDYSAYFWLCWKKLTKPVVHLSRRDNLKTFGEVLPTIVELENYALTGTLAWM